MLNLHTCFEYYDKEKEMPLNGKTMIITVELSKLEDVVKKPVKDMSIQEYWVVYFRYLTDTSKRAIINEIVNKEDGIAMASEVIMQISRDEEERARIMRDEKILLDYQSGINYRLKEVARNALAEGLPHDVVQKITGLLPETIENLDKN